MERQPNDKPKFKCCICKKEIIGYGNNPNPYMFHGRCCDKCNREYVIPLRFMLAKQENKT